MFRKFIMGSFFVSTSKQLLHKETIHRLLKDQFWSKDIPIEYVSRFIDHSCCFGVYKKETNEQVGFARVITDYTTYAYMCDLVIDEKHRGQGLGANLVDSIMAHPDLQGLKAWTMRTTEDARKIYEKRGFKVAEHPETNLEIENLKIYSDPGFKNLHKNDEVNSQIYSRPNQ